MSVTDLGLSRSRPSFLAARPDLVVGSREELPTPDVHVPTSIGSTSSRRSTPVLQVVEAIAPLLADVALLHEPHLSLVLYVLGPRLQGRHVLLLVHALPLGIALGVDDPLGAARQLRQLDVRRRWVLLDPVLWHGLAFWPCHHPWRFSRRSGFAGCRCLAAPTLALVPRLVGLAEEVVVVVEALVIAPRLRVVRVELGQRLAVLRRSHPQKKLQTRCPRARRLSFRVIDLRAEYTSSCKQESGHQNINRAGCRLIDTKSPE